jgi:hypothetical protein
MKFEALVELIPQRGGYNTPQLTAHLFSKLLWSLYPWHACYTFKYRPKHILRTQTADCGYCRGYQENAVILLLTGAKKELK